MKKSTRAVVKCFENDSKKYYPILIESSFENVEKNIFEVCPKSKRFVVITDDVVRDLHGDRFMAAFKSSTKVDMFVVPNGEATKCREWKAKIEDWMFNELNCHRDCAMIALGGGVVGDLVGFVAATFMRGVPFVQVPTTMLAMVDSSVGGKTAIDTPSGKNLVGAFHQPKLVFMDLSTLKTLPSRQLSNGLCEAIKMAACLDKSFFEFLEANVDAALALDFETTSRIVQRSVELKRDVVVEDEKERGLRAVLNWGHTIGHAVEHIMQPDMLHGECVAVGIVKEIEIARALDLCSSATHGRVVRVLKAYRLPTRLPERVQTKDALNYMRFDKKNTSGKIKMILLKSFGSVLDRPS
jgi:pentafunctional AROM polypeptide